MAENTKNENITNILTQKLIDTRTVLIYGEINQELAEDVSKQLLLLESISNDPITILLIAKADTSKLVTRFMI